MIRSLIAIWTLAGCVDDGGPRLETVEPSAAGRGTTVTVTGRRLCGESGDCATAGGEVQIGLDLPAVNANVVALSNTTAMIVIPQITPVGPTELVLTVNERASNALDFEVLQ